MEREVSQCAQNIKTYVLVQGKYVLFALLATLHFQCQSLALAACLSDSQFLTFHSLCSLRVCARTSVSSLVQKF